jgi:glycosyltransferase involved in cell wall biosynthesis
MPAFNAAATLERTFEEIPFDLVDRVILVDDGSRDETAKISTQLGVETIVHNRNLGYGANQKTCYRSALEGDEQIIIMLHPDYQYTPKLIPAMASLIGSGLYDVVLGSRILSKGALEGGMPRYKYFANRILTFVQNFLVGHKLSEYHTGYRAFHRRVLDSLPFEENSDDFLFDNQILVQIIRSDYKIGEITCPTNYFPEASSISLGRSVRYGLGVLWVTAQALAHRLGLAKPKFLRGRRVKPANYQPPASIGETSDPATSR